jgi:hypothetical protein
VIFISQTQPRNKSVYNFHNNPPFAQKTGLCFVLPEKTPHVDCKVSECTLSIIKMTNVQIRYTKNPVF